MQTNNLFAFLVLSIGRTFPRISFVFIPADSAGEIRQISLVIDCRIYKNLEIDVIPANNGVIRSTLFMRALSSSNPHAQASLKKVSDPADIVSVAVRCRIKRRNAEE